MKQSDSKATVLSHTDFFGTYPEPDDGPQAFLVEVEGEIFPHYHRVDQFQIVVGGGGTIGKHPLDPVAIHYVDNHTPYGPINASATENIAFYTLRAHNDRGAFRMPGSEKTVRSGRSYTVASGLVPGRVTDGASLESPLPLQDDGLGAFVLRVPAGETQGGPAPSGAGQFHIVVNGSCLYHGTELAERSLLWVGPDDEPLRVEAGHRGAELLVLQLPRRP